MGTISTAFGGAKSLEFNSFKSVSNQFRSGKIGANIYLEECSKLLDDATKFEDFLPEMIVLLPNISKQKVLPTIILKIIFKSFIKKNNNTNNTIIDITILFIGINGCISKTIS